MAEPGPSAAQLKRILYLLPRASGPEPVALEALARAVGSTPAEVMADLGAVTDREYYQEAGAAEGIIIVQEGDTVWVSVADEFRRPVRLTPREAFALGTGLRLMAAGADAVRGEEIRSLAARVEEALSAPVPDRYRDGRPDPGAPQPLDLLRAGVEASHEDRAGIRAVILTAAAERRRCRIDYAKPGAPRLENREVDPYAVVLAGGLDYLLGWCVRAEDVRAFRLDRILGVEVAGAEFEIPPDFDPTRYLSGGRLYWSPQDVEAVIRYSPQIARWIEEKGETEPQPDGSVIVRHRVADAGWAVRHVLQYGGEAELLEPQGLRGAVAQAAERMAGMGGGASAPRERVEA
jgi:proteasome accessory factor C